MVARVRPEKREEPLRLLARMLVTLGTSPRKAAWESALLLCCDAAGYPPEAGPRVLQELRDLGYVRVEDHGRGRRIYRLTRKGARASNVPAPW